MRNTAKILVAIPAIVAGLALTSGLRAQDSPGAGDSNARQAPMGGGMPMMQMMERMNRMMESCEKMMASARGQSGGHMAPQAPAPKKE